MPIVRQVIGTRRQKRNPSDAIAKIEDIQKRDESLHTVRFRNIEDPGGRISFHYRGHGRTVYQITLDDGEVCDLPLGLIMNMRSNCKTPDVPEVRLKDGPGTKNSDLVSAFDMDRFQIAENQVTGQIRPPRHDLYVLEFVSSELEGLEKLYNMGSSPSKAKLISPRKGK